MDEYSSFTRQASVGAHGYIFVYSITSSASLAKLKQVRENLLNLIGNDAVPLILVAQKCDLKEYSEVPSEEGRALAQRWNCPYIEVSAKMNSNVGTFLVLNLLHASLIWLAGEHTASCCVTILRQRSPMRY